MTTTHLSGSARPSVFAVIEGGKSQGKPGVPDGFQRRTRLRRAREAALGYEAEAARLLADAKSGYLALSGNAAADGYGAWERADANARETAGAKLTAEERKVYLALTKAQSERNRSIASNFAAAEGRAAHAALIDAELSRIGEETWTLASTLAGRVALLEAGFPAVRRLAEEKREALGLPEEAASQVFASAIQSAAVAAAETGRAADPVGCAGFIEAAREYLPETYLRAVHAPLKAAVTRRLAIDAAEDALSRTGSREVALHLVAESGLPKAVRTLSGEFALRKLEQRRKAEREAEIAAELKAREALARLGGDPSLLPEELWLRLSPRTRADIAGGRVRITDARRASRLARQACERPGEFAEADLTLWFHDLSLADYAMFAAYRDSLRGGSGEKPPPSIERLALSHPPEKEEKLAPAPEVLAELGRELKRLTGRMPNAGCCRSLALAHTLDLCGIIRQSDRRAVLEELLTHHYGG